MKAYQSGAGLLLGISALFAPAALAQEQGDVTAILMSQNNNNESAPVFHTVEGFKDAAACLDAAWIHSIVPPGGRFSLKSPVGVTVQCLQNGETIGAQACAGGDCTALEPASLKR